MPLGNRRMPEFDLDFTLLLISSGLMIGLMYALIALGFVLVYKATDAINFAQGEFVMLAAIIAAAAMGAGMPFWLAVCWRWRHGRVLLRARARRAAQAARPANRRSDHGDHRPCVADRGVATLVFGAGVRALEMPVGDDRCSWDRSCCRRCSLSAPASAWCSCQFHLVLPENAHGRGDARGGVQPDRVDGDGYQRAALLRAGLGADWHRLGARRCDLGQHAGRRQPVAAGRAEGVPGGDPGWARIRSSARWSAG